MTRQKAGTLLNARFGHSVIFDGEKFLVIGGWRSDRQPKKGSKNEVCTLKGSTMTCVEQSKSLDNYAQYPALFLVAEDFGKKIQNC